MIRGRAGLAESDDEATTRARIGATVGEYISSDEDRRWVEPALLTLLGLEPPPAGGRDVLFAAWRIFFEGIANRGTTVLMFEDIQWADPGLLDFIDHVLEWSRGFPILVIALAPYVWMVLTSLKPQAELSLWPVRYLPQNATLDHYRELIGRTSFSGNLLNSLVKFGFRRVLRLNQAHQICDIVLHLGIARLNLSSARYVTEAKTSPKGQRF